MLDSLIDISSCDFRRSLGARCRKEAAVMGARDWIAGVADKPLGNLSLVEDPEGARATSLVTPDKVSRQEALLGPLEVAAYVGTQLTLMLGVWASAGVVVLTIMNSSHTRGQYMYWFLLNLSVSTIISGCGEIRRPGQTSLYHPMTMGVAFKNFLDTGKYAITSPDICFAANVLVSSYRSVACSSIFLMALERYVTIRKPLTHCYILTGRRIRLSISGTWALAFSFAAGLFVHRLAFKAPSRISFCSLDLFEVRRVNAAQICFGSCLYVCVLAIYVHLQVIARRHLRIIEEERRSFGLAQYQRNVKRSSVALRITLFILSVDVPIYVMNVLLWVSPRADGEKYMKGIIMLLVVSQILQPLFYSLLSSDFRKSLRSLFGRNRVGPEAGGGRVRPEPPRSVARGAGDGAADRVGRRGRRASGDGVKGFGSRCN
ncbi:melanocortin receptor 5-like [Penaeus chinensis]|uniref:melanocortin receptor 5-like n=1 Tax=Penaeus chinensis TaxID=139456 RepID=UPI001FB5C4BD|nr:melanocortin receptor 5-like [Penaeus chinensis]